MKRLAKLNERKKKINKTHWKKTRTKRTLGTLYPEKFKNFQKIVIIKRV